jgi:hypothetical protein
LAFSTGEGKWLASAGDGKSLFFWATSMTGAL